MPFEPTRVFGPSFRFGCAESARSQPRDRPFAWATIIKHVWQRTEDEINRNIDEAVERDTDRLTTAIYALLAGVAPPLLYPIFLWLLAGFRKSAPDANAVSNP